MTVDHCRVEQRRCAEHLKKHGWDDGAALGMSDWLHEELILEKERNDGQEA
jgi:hypothetical protein